MFNIFLTEHIEQFSFWFLAKILSNFYYIVDDLVKNLSYVRNVSIRGAPYDFRKAPSTCILFA